MKSKLRLVAAITVLGLLSTGCFALRGFVWKAGRVKVGQKVALLLYLRPASNLGNKSYPFVLVGLQEGDGGMALKISGPRKFDIKGAFGGPLELVRDNALRDHVLEDAPACSSLAGADDPNVQWILYRTPEPVKDKGKFAKTAVTKITFEGIQGGQVQRVGVNTGGWMDEDESGAPNGVEEVGCSGGALTSILVGKETPED